MSMSLKIVLAASILYGLVWVDGTNCPGCTPLDKLSFDKVVGHFKATVVKFDVAYPYGDKHEEYTKLAADLAGVNDVLVADVGVKDYGEKENADLAEKYHIRKEDFPVVMVFIPNTETNLVSQYRYKGDEFTNNALKNFVRRTTGIYLPLPGCIEEFDAYANRLIKAETVGERGRVMAEAEKTLIELKDTSKKNNAEAYIKIMRKVVKEGLEFVETEIERVRKVLKGKLSDTKKKQMEGRINVLQNFKSTNAPKDEKIEL